jgi:long-subunit fatty acid transport protein
MRISESESRNPKRGTPLLFVDGGTLTRFVSAIFIVFAAASFAYAQEGGSGGSSGGTDPTASAVVPAKPKPWWVGGTVGLNFGENVNYIEFSPQIAYQLSRRFQLGVSIIYRYKKDKRFEPDLSTTDYGASLFGRYYIWGPIFAQAEVERRLWEYPLIIDEEGNYEKIETDYTGYYAGVGFAFGSNANAGMFMTLLYDFSYDSSQPMPHSHPWIFRIGYGVRF